MAIRKPRKKEAISRGSELEIINIETRMLTAHPQNTRMHDERNIQAIARSLTTYGQRTPLVIGNGVNQEGRHYILKGCGTWEAMRRIGMEKCAVVQVTHLSDAEELAYSIADNKTGDTSEFDFESLVDVMQYLQDEGIELSETGFADYEIEPLLKGDVGPEPEQEHMETSRQQSQRISFSDDEWDTISRAVAIFRRKHKQDATDAGALVMICDAFNITNMKTPPLKKMPCL
jgi:ParB-like chromosome segregation protein Spo0J